MDADLRQQVEMTRALRPAASRLGRAPAQPAAPVSLLPAVKALAPVVAICGGLGWCIYPVQEHQVTYARAAVEAQQIAKIGTKTPGGYAVAGIDVFPTPEAGGAPYDYAVTLITDGYRGTARVQGSYDYSDGRIVIARPVSNQAASIETTGVRAANLLTGWLTAALDSNAEVRLGAEAMTAARNLVVYRVPERDRALLDGADVEQIHRTRDGLHVVYSDGAAAGGWACLVLAMAGAVAWITTRS